VPFFLRRRMKNHIRPAMIARPTTPPTTPPAIAPVLDEEDPEELPGSLLENPPVIAPVLDEEDPEELPGSLLENPPVPLAVVMTVTVPPPPADDPADAVFVVTTPGTLALSADDMLVVALGEGVPEGDVPGINEIVEMTGGGAGLVEGEVVEGVVVVVISIVVGTDVVTVTLGAVEVSAVVVGASYVTARYWVKPLNSSQPRLVYLNTQLVDTTASRIH
jgi:hypothetical protein